MLPDWNQNPQMNTFFKNNEFGLIPKSQISCNNFFDDSEFDLNASF